MQALYGLKQAEKSNFSLSIDHLAEVFSPDLNSMEVQDKEKIAQDRKSATELFRSVHEKKRELVTSGSPPEIKKAVSDASGIMEDRNRKDRRHYKQLVIKEVDSIYNNYLLSLVTILKLVEFSDIEEEEDKQKYVKKGGISWANLRNNSYVKRLREDESFNKLVSSKKIQLDHELTRNVFKSVIKKDEVILEYAGKTSVPDEEDKQILLHIAKNIIFKDKNFEDFFDEKDLNWQENKDIIKSLTVKTIKSMGKEPGEVLLDITGNWEEDSAFFNDLYDATLKHEDWVEDLIAKNAENWDIERVTLIDNIILKMALAEMVEFPSIPVKVTINEYIELCKTYSTPKSKQFVNGLLDAMSEELIQKGEIRKSGRGLIDNK